MDPRVAAQQQQLALQRQRQQLAQQQEEARRKQQMEQQQAQQHQLQRMRQMQELKRQQDQERLMQQEKLRKTQEEQRAAFAIRRILQQLRVCTPENFGLLVKALEEMLASELRNCGSLEEQVKKEAEQGIHAGKDRAEQQVRERQAAEETKLEKQRLRKENLEKFETLTKEVDVLVNLAEDASAKLKLTIEPFTGDLQEEGFQQAAKAVEEAGAFSRERGKACTDFITTHGEMLKTQTEPEPKQAMVKFFDRINVCARDTEKIIWSSAEVKEKALRRRAAKNKTEKVHAVFKKYDKDEDGMLSRNEVLDYAKTEFNFKVPAEALDSMFDILVPDGSQGVKVAQFHKLKVSVGVARETARDAQRREEREKRAAEVQRKRRDLEDLLVEVSADVASAEEAVKQFEVHVTPLQSKGKLLNATQMAEVADEVDEFSKVAAAGHEKGRKRCEDLAEGCEPELVAFLKEQVQPLKARLVRIPQRMQGAKTLLARFRAQILAKQAEELRGLRSQIRSMVKYHQTKRKFTPDQLFTEFDTDKDGAIGQAEWTAWFKTCEREPHESKAAEEKATGDAEKKMEAEVEKPNTEVPAPSDADLARVHADLLQDGEARLAKDAFLRFARIFMKVVKETVCTEELSIKSKTCRRLELDEVMEILEGPTKVQASGVSRVNVRVMRDDLVAWVTLAGNAGSVFLEEGGDTFKVARETLLTAEADEQKADRKLLPGEIVDVIEWPKREASSGLVRMKCRAQKDGAVGWATTVGNQGTVHLENH